MLTTTQPETFLSTLAQLEPVFKHWMHEVLNSEKTHEAPEPETPATFYTRNEVKDLLKISLPTLHRYTELGLLRGRKIGNRVLYKISDVEQAFHDLKKNY